MADDSKPPRFSTPKQPAPKSTTTPKKPVQPAQPAQPTQPASPEPSSEQPAPSKEQQPEEQEPIPDFSKLPDLTQGIPSTLEYERAGANAKESLGSALRQELEQEQDREREREHEHEAAAGGSGGPGGKRPKGELPASAYVSSSERKRQRMVVWALGLFGAGAVASTAYLGRNWDEEELSRNPEIPNGWSIGNWWKRAYARMTDTVTYYQEPAFEKLLPDTDPSFERPYTLCISLEDMLVHSEWSREHGWRVAKRPGVDYFLHYLSQYYEIVLFTTVPFGTGEPLVRKLDPFRFIMWPLFREATKYKDGEIVKVQYP